MQSKLAILSSDRKEVSPRGAENQENQGVRFIWTDLAIFALSGEGLRCVTGVRFMEFMEEKKLVCGQEGLRWKIFLTARAS